MYSIDSNKEYCITLHLVGYNYRNLISSPFIVIFPHHMMLPNNYGSINAVKQRKTWCLIVKGRNMFSSMCRQTHWKNMYINDRQTIPVQAWTGPRDPEGLGFQISRQSTREGGKFVSPTHRPSFPRRKHSWYSFLLEAEYVNEKSQ